MLQAAVLDGVAFDPFSFQQDGLPAPEVDIGRREVFQALVIALVVVVIDEPADAGFEIARQVIVCERNMALIAIRSTAARMHSNIGPHPRDRRDV
jgi:hypothetical protein